MKYESFNNYSNTFVYDTGIEGKTITIFGGIHGNETVGVEVINKLLDDLKKGVIQLLTGKLILAYGNEKAIKIGKREDEYNLNRLFKAEYLNKYSDKYEIIRAQQLAEIMKKSDVLLDIHSVSSDSVPFIFSEDIKSEIDIAKAIYNGKIIIGRGNIAGDLLSGDTDGYMHTLGKISFTLECGNHNSDKAFDIGYTSLIKLLNYFGLIKDDISKIIKPKTELIEMYKIETTKTGNFKFNSNISNFKKIKKGDLIGFNDTEKLYATENFIILLPNYEIIKPGDEVFYYGRKY